MDGCTCFFRGDVGKIDLSCEDNLVCLTLLTILSDKGHISIVPLLQQRAKSCGNIIHFNSLCGVGVADATLKLLAILRYRVQVQGTGYRVQV